MDSPFLLPFFYQSSQTVPYLHQPPGYEVSALSSYPSNTYMSHGPPYTTGDSDSWPYPAGLDIQFSLLSSTPSASPSPPYISAYAPVMMKTDVSPTPSNSACVSSALEGQSISDSLDFLQQVLQENLGRRLTITDSLRGTRKTQASHDRRRKSHIAHRCFICGQGFTTKHRVKEHIDAHCGLKRYRAPCGFESSYRHDAKRHSTRCATCRDSDHQPL